MKLVGYIEGVEIKFDFYPPKYFKGVIPKKLSGQYIMQLTLIDDFGNEDGGVYKYMYVDFNSLHFHILDENFKFSKKDEDKKYIKIEKLFESRAINDIYSFEKLGCKYSYRELVNKCFCN